MTLNENNSTTLSNNEQNLSLAAPKGQIIFTDATTTITLEELKNLSTQIQQLQSELALLKKQQAQLLSQAKN
ncbi:MAG: hypothetical protein JSU07_09085 [Bacteroidetes bacterium]|nr:hypothetical protein [Bacteroidota bacterium]